jgi:hypothetical protein
MAEEKSGDVNLVVRFDDNSQTVFKMTKEELTNLFEAEWRIIGADHGLIWFWYDNKTKIGAIDMYAVKSVETVILPGE